ncbi:MAG: T9SS type A sorting domain-containing protein [Ignavibacteriaceae bacterium]|nr:T9SS type A sorting domain-containing protein [Ignavibacteriaceae bacterium]
MKHLRTIFTTFFLVMVISHFHQTFSQTEWTKYNNGDPVLLAGSAGEWDDNGFVGLSVIVDGTTYKMWYGAWNGTTFRIGYATSPDGINWTKYNDPSTPNPPFAESDPVLNPGPGAFESGWVYGPQVYFDGTIYHMWYAGTDGNHDRVGYATSTDGGITWEKDTLNNPVINLGSPGRWDDASVDPGPVLFNGTNYEMIYNGYDGFIYQGGYATSIDGFTWNKEFPDPIFVVGADTSWNYPRVNPSAVVYNSYDSLYYLFYSGGDLFDWKIGYATAPAFSGPWAKDSLILLDSSAAAFPGVIYDPDDSLYKMWYSGDGIEYATAPINIPTSIEEERFDEIPTDFTLSQNYPNPFNPTTKIKYSVPQASKVQFKVFDVLGNEIEILVNDEKQAGTYELTWNAINLPSGVYFYQLNAVDPSTGSGQSFISTKKMILLK